VGHAERADAFGVEPESEAVPVPAVASPLADGVGKFGKARHEHGVVEGHQVGRVHQGQRFELRPVRLGVLARLLRKLREPVDKRLPCVDEFQRIV
jgi:hypothetical protein